MKLRVLASANHVPKFSNGSCLPDLSQRGSRLRWNTGVHATQQLFPFSWITVPS
jgi:hypothetical protein